MNKEIARTEEIQERKHLVAQPSANLQTYEPKKTKLLAYGYTEDEEDYWSAADAAEGVQIFGGTGSGKTSGSGKAIAYSYLKSGFGGLVLAVKQDEVENWKKYCEDTGRYDDLVIFSPENSQNCCFNFLEYEKNRSGRSAGNVDNIVSLFLEVLEIAGRNKDDNGGGKSVFYSNTLKQLLTNAIELIILSGQKGLTLFDVKNIISSAAHKESDLKTKKWQDGLCCTLLANASARTKSDNGIFHDYEIIKHYWMQEYPKLAPETRSNIEIMFTSMANVFLRNPMRDLFCNQTAMTPEITGDGKIILIDMPVLEYNEAGLYANILWKLIWQRTMEKRNIKESPRSVFLWADEAQYFINKKDRVFQTTARSQRICTVYLTQNVPNYVSVLGEDETNALLGNLNTKIFHSNTDKSTNEYASELVGRAYMEKWTFTEGENEGTNTSSGSSTSWSENGGNSSNSNSGRSQGYSRSRSVTEELEYQLLPEFFTGLNRGGGNPPIVEGVVFQMGKSIWPISQSNFLVVGFRQDSAGEINVYNEVVEQKNPVFDYKSYLTPSIIMRFVMIWLIALVVCSIFGFSGLGLHFTAILVASLGTAYIVKERRNTEFAN